MEDLALFLLGSGVLFVMVEFSVVVCRYIAEDRRAERREGSGSTTGKKTRGRAAEAA